MNVLQSVQVQSSWPSRPAAPTPAIGEVLDAIDATDTAILRGRDDIESSRANIPKGIAAAVGGVMTIAGTVLALAGTAAAAPIAVTAGVVVIAGAVVAASSRSEVRQAEAALQQKNREAADLARQLEERCVQGRPANERSFLESGGDGLALMRHVESDPYVAVAANRHAHASHLVAQNRSLLEMTRDDRFAAAAPRVQEITSDRADALGLWGLLGMVGTGWVGMCVGTTVGSPSLLLAGLATAACEWIVLRRYGHDLVKPGVDNQLKKELAAEVAYHEPTLPTLRHAEETMRQSALEHYSALLASAAQSSPGKVRVEDEQVVVGGVAIPRHGEQ